MSRRIVRALLMVVGLGAGLGVASMAWAGGLGSHGGGHGAQGYLGVDVRDVSDEQMNLQHLRDKNGAEIIRVDHDGPAGKAGLREHDVVLQLNGQSIATQEQLRHCLHDTAPGQNVTLLITRDGQQQTVTATMANRQEVERRAWEQHIVVPDPAAPVEAEASEPPPPTPAGGKGFFHANPGGGHTRNFLGTMLGAPYTGLALEPVGAQLGEYFGVQSGVGLLVKSVEPNSPGATAGVRAGDVVLKVNQVALSTESDWTRMLHENKGKAVPVLIVRDRKEQTVTLTPDPKRKASATGGGDGSSVASLARMDLLHGTD